MLALNVFNLSMASRVAAGRTSSPWRGLSMGSQGSMLANGLGTMSPPIAPVGIHPLQWNFRSYQSAKTAQLTTWGQPKSKSQSSNHFKGKLLNLALGEMRPAIGPSNDIHCNPSTKVVCGFRGEYCEKTDIWQVQRVIRSSSLCKSENKTKLSVWTFSCHSLRSGGGNHQGHQAWRASGVHALLKLKNEPRSWMWQDDTEGTIGGAGLKSKWGTHTTQYAQSTPHRHGWLVEYSGTSKTKAPRESMSSTRSQFWLHQYLNSTHFFPPSLSLVPVFLFVFTTMPTVHSTITSISPLASLHGPNVWTPESDPCPWEQTVGHVTRLGV